MLYAEVTKVIIVASTIIVITDAGTILSVLPKNKMIRLNSDTCPIDSPTNTAVLFLNPNIPVIRVIKNGFTTITNKEMTNTGTITDVMLAQIS